MFSKRLPANYQKICNVEMFLPRSQVFRTREAKERPKSYRTNVEDIIRKLCRKYNCSQIEWFGTNNTSQLPGIQLSLSTKYLWQEEISQLFWREYNSD